MFNYILNIILKSIIITSFIDFYNLNIINIYDHLASLIPQKWQYMDKIYNSRFDVHA